MIGNAVWDIWLSGDLGGLTALWFLMLPIVVVVAGIGWLRDLGTDHRGGK